MPTLTATATAPALTATNPLLHLAVSNRTSPREGNRALYFDFEGRKNQPPLLLGVLHGDTYRVLVLDRTFAPLVRNVAIDGVSVCLRTLPQALAELLAMAQAGGADRRLVAFSLHELQVIDQYVGRPAAAAVAARYLNARKLFAAWLHRTRPDLRVEELSLGHSATALGYEWPDAGTFSPADAIKRLRQQLATAQRQGRQPGPHTEALWRELIAYNREDCRATQYLTRMTAQLARPSARAATRHTATHVPAAVAR